MKETFYLKDGSTYVLFSTNELFELISEKIGSDMSRYLETYITQLKKETDYVSKAIETDLYNYESSLDSNNAAFNDIRDECKTMLKQYQNESGRNRLAVLTPWYERIKQILKIVNNQI